MKRFFTIAATLVVALLCASEASAQRIGIVGGASFTGIQDVADLSVTSRTGFSAGLTSQIKLPIGFSIQPALLYTQKSAHGEMMKISDTFSSEGAIREYFNSLIDVGYLELPVSIQWGPDLLLFRPFVDVTPFVGYALYNKVSEETMNADQSSSVVDVTENEWKGHGLNRFSYGVGLGGGLEIWRLQVACRYFWNLGPLFNNDGSLALKPVNSLFQDKNFGGVTLSLAFMFGR